MSHRIGSKDNFTSTAMSCALAGLLSVAVSIALWTSPIDFRQWTGEWWQDAALSAYEGQQDEETRILRRDEPVSKQKIRSILNDEPTCPKRGEAVIVLPEADASIGICAGRKATICRRRHCATGIIDL